MAAPKAFLDPDPDIDPDTLLPWFESLGVVFPAVYGEELKLIH